MYNAECVDIGKSSESLIDVEFHLKDCNIFFSLPHLLQHPVEIVWHILHYYIEIDLILSVTARCIERMPQCDYIWMKYLFHDCKLPILESLILKNLLNGNNFSCLCDTRLSLSNDKVTYLIHGPKCSSTHNSLSMVSESTLRIYLINVNLLITESGTHHLACKRS